MGHFSNLEVLIALKNTPCRFWKNILSEHHESDNHLQAWFCGLEMAFILMVLSFYNGQLPTTERLR